jgi:hypothetical protein
MSGNNTIVYYGSHGMGPLSFAGFFTMQGPQAVNDEGGVPKWVHDVFESNPDIQQVAISRSDSGHVYTRMGSKPEILSTYRFLLDAKNKVTQMREETEKLEKVTETFKSLTDEAMEIKNKISDLLR